MACDIRNGTESQTPMGLAGTSSLAEGGGGKQGEGKRNGKAFVGGFQLLGVELCRAVGYFFLLFFLLLSFLCFSVPWPGRSVGRSVRFMPRYATFAFFCSTFLWIGVGGSVGGCGNGWTVKTVSQLAFTRALPSPSLSLSGL